MRKAAEFLVGFKDEDTGRRAPYSPQERWENQSGYSPNSIAAQISGLVVRRRHGARRAATRARRSSGCDRPTAGRRKVEDWTVTTNGPLSEEPYFLRLTKNGEPDTASPYAMGDGGPESIDQRAVVDPSFLDLVRYGIIAPDDPEVLSTLPVIDDELGFTTPNGPFWHRFSRDGYGETRDGGQWEITEPGTFTTLGRGWPLLTGERGEYAVTAGEDGAPYLATDGCRVRRERHDLRAGLGRPPADRRALLPGRARAPVRRRRWCGRTPAWCGSRGPSSRGARSTSRPSWPTATTG